MKTILGLSLLLAFCGTSFAQTNSAQQYRHPAGNRTIAARTTIADAAENNYDIKYLKFDLNVTNTSTDIGGNVITRATVTASSLSTYVFELDTSLHVDSATINGTLYSVATTGSIRSILLPTPLPGGSMFTAQVYYHGTPLPASAYSLGGLFNPQDPGNGANTLFTVSEPYHAADWWPCKQALRDKIDSVDMWITVPDSLKAGSNGLLMSTTHVDAAHTRYEWKERKPIDYYLISIAVGPYIDYSYYMHFSGSTDSMLVQNYVYNNPATLPYYQSLLDSTGRLLDYFSTLYGRYPFWKEKYGLSMVYWGGAEEHQTMTTMGTPALNINVLAHELGHQWFGDNVTCGTWGDIMMNEGFAEYTNYLYIDQFQGHATALSTMDYYQSYVKSYDTGSTYVYDTTSEDRILDGRLTYDKGTCILHTLRSVVNNDSDYFHIYQHYQQQYAGGNGTAADFRDVAKGLLGTVVNGINLDTFFNQWVYLEGFPKYSVRWNQIGTDVYVQLTQTTSDPSSVALFKVPLDLQLRSVAGDTVVRVLNDQQLQTFHFSWDRAMGNIVLDPEYWLTYKLISRVHDLTLNIDNMNAPAVVVLPNPATDHWAAENIPQNSVLSITDMSGRVLWQLRSTNASVVIPADKLASGVYVLSIRNEDGQVNNYRLVKE